MVTHMNKASLVILKTNVPSKHRLISFPSFLVEGSHRWCVFRGGFMSRH